MVIGPDTARKPRPEELDEVDRLLCAAFQRPDEARLVRRLRADGAFAQEYAMPWQGRIGAYCAISRMVAPQNWFCLAPVAVLPEWQGGALARDERQRHYYRFGSRLVRMVSEDFARGEDWFLRILRQADLITGDEPPTLVVLGKPSFYARAGFSQERAARLTSPYPIDHTLIARPGADVPKARLIYPRAFDGL